MEYLQNYRDGNPNWKKGKKSGDDGVGGAVFGQVGARSCYKCGEIGHLANKCPHDSDDEKVIKHRKAWKERSKL